LLALDTHLARRASNGGATFNDRGGPYGRMGRHHDVEVRRVGWDDKQPVFRPMSRARLDRRVLATAA
jgi:hypothetical protein